ncbi:MAG TPA: NAD-dependent epimerase/dehydratase family protein [Candidatus Polarisedimenticolia bacterium]|jgi:farnesol dehydrogenase|nr:NAD-dependent epimerase/dehydratase family protein [Candidatus Polarisedimenticolia bacterium]
MRVFLTGGTGFLGHELLRALHARRHQVTALVRAPEAAATLPPGVDPIVGTVERPESYRAALAGQDAVVHAAALVKMWARDRSEFDRVNVSGTERLVREASDAKVAKVVYTSSFIALGPSNGRPLREDDARRERDPHNDYERSKMAADAVARKLVSEGHPLFILYPGVIYGPGRMTDGNLVARNVIEILKGTMPFGMALEAWSYAFVDDVVAGFVKVLETAPASQRYILGGDNRTGPEFYAALASASGRPAPRFKIPFALAAAAGWSEYALAQLLGRPPRLLTHEVVRIYRRAWAYDSARATAELGYSITPLEEGLRRLVDWLRKTGKVS